MSDMNSWYQKSCNSVSLITELIILTPIFMFIEIQLLFSSSSFLSFHLFTFYFLFFFLIRYLTNQKISKSWLFLKYLSCARKVLASSITNWQPYNVYYKAKCRLIGSKFGKQKVTAVFTSYQLTYYAID